MNLDFAKTTKVFASRHFPSAFRVSVTSVTRVSIGGRSSSASDYQSSTCQYKFDKAHSMVPSTRVAVSILLRASRSTASHTKPQRWSNSYRAIALPVSKAVRSQVRWQSQDSAAGDGSTKAYSFEDVSLDTPRNARSHRSSIVQWSVVSNTGT
jgi:hypothetical protein